MADQQLSPWREDEPEQGDKGPCYSWGPLTSALEDLARKAGEDAAKGLKHGLANLAPTIQLRRPRRATVRPLDRKGVVAALPLHYEEGKSAQTGTEEEVSGRQEAPDAE